MSDAIAQGNNAQGHAAGVLDRDWSIIAKQHGVPRGSWSGML